MAYTPETRAGAVHQECPRCGLPTIHQRRGLPFTVTTDAQRLTPGQAEAQASRTRLAWCLRESKWSGTRLVEILPPFHNRQCPWPHVLDHQCPPEAREFGRRPEGAMW